MLGRRWAGAFSFGHDEPHSVIIILLTMSAALLLAGGAAVDFARVSNMREAIEAAVRAGSAAGLNALGDASLSDDEVEAATMSRFEKGVAFARQVGTIDAPAISIDRVAKTVTVGATGTVSMTISRLCGLDEVTVPAISTAASGATQSSTAP